MAVTGLLINHSILFNFKIGGYCWNGIQEILNTMVNTRSRGYPSLIIMGVEPTPRNRGAPSFASAC